MGSPFEIVPENPEQQARRQIDEMLKDAGWQVQSVDEVNVSAGRGVAVREFPLKRPFGFADYLLLRSGPTGRAGSRPRRKGTPLTHYEIQSIPSLSALH